MSRRASSGVLIAIVLAVVVALLLGRRDDRATADPLAPVSEMPAAVAGDEVAVAPVAEAAAARSSVAAEPAVPPPVAPVVAPAPVPAPDLEARLPLAIVVLDERRQPVFDAAIRIAGARSSESRGDYHELRGGAVAARTDARGRAELSYFAWVDRDGRTVSVDLFVTHPEFVPFRDDDFEVGPGDREVVLARGAVVSVRAWRGAPSRVVEDVEVQLERDAALGPDAWTRESDGRLVTTRIAPGRHLLRALHRPKDGPPVFSAVESFELAPNERVDLVLELEDALEVRGTLDDSVPRPVVDGRVMLSVQETPAPNVVLWQSFDVAVLADGTFTIPGVPRGRGYVFALARGFVSAREPATTLADLGVASDPGRTPDAEQQALRAYGDDARILQRVDVPPPTAPFTIRMVATGTVEVAVVDEEDRPLPEATVTVSPNVSFPAVGSLIVPWREWSAKADERGIARFEDVPPDERLWLGAGAPGRRLREAERREPPSVPVVSGALAQRTVVLERDELASPSPK